MASLNLSTEGPSIKSSYLGVVNGPVPSGASPTAASWALFSVKAPLLNAFQSTGAKDSILRVQGTGTGELAELFEDFSEGHIQFAFVRVKDPNTGLPKNVLIAWCGGGVPERTKGYFTSHLNAVSKVLHGYHVQITARSDSDLDPDVIIQKVADASGAKYSAGTPGIPASSGPAPPVAKKPVFTPTASSSQSNFNPLLAARSRELADDDDGWGADAPPVTRTQLEKVESAYKPTKVSMADLMKNKDESTGHGGRGTSSPDVVKGAYQPVGKVDIAALRAQAKRDEDVRPAPVKGAYEPVGKVDIAAIRAKAKKPVGEAAPEPPKPVAERSAVFRHASESERLTSLPKPKVAKKFGGAASFTGTKPPTPGAMGFRGPAATPTAPPVGAASRTFADKDGKTPAQLWAEKKAKQAGDAPISPMATATSPVTSQKSGSEWKSGYTGKSWAVDAPTYKRDVSGGVDAHATGDSSTRDGPSGESGGLSSIKDRFPDAPPPFPGVSSASRGVQEEPSAPPPPPDSSRPAGDFAIPGLPTRSAKPEVEEPPQPDPYGREDSPIRVAMPVARGADPEPQHVEPEPTPAPRPIPPPVEPEPEPEPEPQMYATHQEPQTPAAPVRQGAGKRALIQYDYDKAEDNEIELRENEYVTNIDMVDEDWWMGTNSLGETGLFPSNYVELVDDDDDVGARDASASPPAPLAAAVAADGPMAIALYDYEAAEDNGKWPNILHQLSSFGALVPAQTNTNHSHLELSFPEGANITGLEFPDEDWWFGHYNGQSGLFPANYVERSA
ncbi:hypothetical protein MKZ38_006458 [Zalerion maritima]|uniref:Actin binding protein n=1 Tax=Zalerion maritima TaxID=339359 RepID=A0AAD5WUH8_9PEZI|nr:hypothetical protein MKZ38_006458 [Zalerion maritima]